MHFRATCVAISALAVSALALPSPQSVGNESANGILDAPNLGISRLESRQTDGFKSDVVDRHNAYRKHYDASPLTWSDALYPATQQWANSCKFQHSLRARGNYGENLAMGFGFSTSLDLWMREARYYNFSSPEWPQKSPYTGHFTQVVWKDTKEVACAVANCRTRTGSAQPSPYVVCRYSPPGNIVGRFSQNVGKYTP